MTRYIKIEYDGKIDLNDVIIMRKFLNMIRSYL
jgi:hypothetical protein